MCLEPAPEEKRRAAVSKKVVAIKLVPTTVFFPDHTAAATEWLVGLGGTGHLVHVHTRSIGTFICEADTSNVLGDIHVHFIIAFRNCQNRVHRGQDCMLFIQVHVLHRSMPQTHA